MLCIFLTNAFASCAVSAPFSRTDVPCFPGGSGFGFWGDMDALGVLANCLSRRWAMLQLRIWRVSKSAQHFLRKSFRVCGHLVCLTDPDFFLKDTSAGCFETCQI